MKISKCPSCGGKLDRTFSSCPICGEAFTCSRCGKILPSNEASMCPECYSIDLQTKADACRDIGSELKNLGNELNNLSSML